MLKENIQLLFLDLKVHKDVITQSFQQNNLNLKVIHQHISTNHHFAKTESALKEITNII
jgi:hypothetical protein